MEKTKIIFINLIITLFIMAGFVGYFEWRMKDLTIKNILNNSENIQNISDTHPKIVKDGTLSQESSEDLNKNYEPPKELFYSGDRVPGYAAGEVVSVDDTELILKQPASIELKYQIFRKDVSMVVEIDMNDPQTNPNGNIEMKETPSDWSKISAGSKVNMRLDENQKRVLAIVNKK